jgi:hypothetical protein
LGPPGGDITVLGLGCGVVPRNPLRRLGQQARDHDQQKDEGEESPGMDTVTERMEGGHHASWPAWHVPKLEDLCLIPNNQWQEAEFSRQFLRKKF